MSALTDFPFSTTFQHTEDTYFRASAHHTNLVRDRLQGGGARHRPCPARLPAASRRRRHTGDVMLAAGSGRIHTTDADKGRTGGALALLFLGSCFSKTALSMSVSSPATVFHP